MTTMQQTNPPVTRQQPTRISGLAVRTHLRAGLAWDEVDDPAKALCENLTRAVSTAANTVTGGSVADKSSSSGV